VTDQPEHLHAVRFPGESEEYRQARDALLRVEKDVRDCTEQLAAQRRRLPLGGPVPTDYEFQEWVTRTGSRRGLGFGGGCRIKLAHRKLFVVCRQPGVNVREQIRGAH
jgi:hypothetical protein